MTYFRTGCRTIIGAVSFHAPVRDGKGWDQDAMAARQSLDVVAGLQCRVTTCDEEEVSGLQSVSLVAARSPFIQGYRIKPYGQLVRLSSTCYHACTRRLSTLWSSTTLQGAQGSGKSHLEASFPLRCFQRLSLPSLATRQYDWRHNRYTRGSSTPVLSY